MRCQQVLSGAANTGNSTVVHTSYNDIGYTVYCTGCDLVVLDDNFCRVQLISNISACRSQINAIALCPTSGKIAAVCSHSVYILSVQSTLHDDDYPFKWSVTTILQIGSPVTSATFNHNGVELIVTGTQLFIYNTEFWKCTWSTLLTEEASEVTVSPDGRFFTTLAHKSRIVKLWKKSKDAKDYRSELIPHPDIVVGVCWRQLPQHLPKDAVRQVLLTSCNDCIGRIWLETPQLHPSISVSHSTTKSFVLGTVLDPLKESSEKVVPGSPYIYQWFNNKAHSFSSCIENAILKGDMMLSETVSVSSYDIAEDAGDLCDEEQHREHQRFSFKDQSDTDVNVKDTKEYNYTVSQLVKLWYQSFDLVICVSPASGSLMGWRVEKIDISFPFQALTTRFVLKLPWSLTYADARILKPSFEVFSSRKVCNNSHKNRSILRGKSKNLKRSQARNISELANTLVDLKLMILPSMCLLTAHSDGTVNLFTFEMGIDDVTFTDISNLVHEVRCSGHRCPPIKSLSHPYIPLVLTTSSETGVLSKPGYGELILWRVSCIGPMTTRKTGIMELARVDTKRAADFTEISWFPKAFSVIPLNVKEYAGVLTSFVLHFVAFTGHSLELYRVITLSESLQTATMIMNRTSSIPCDMIGEERLRSKSSGSGASKIYHVGRLADVSGSCSLLHTYSLATVTSDSHLTSISQEKEDYFVAMVNSGENEPTVAHTIQVSISKEHIPGTQLKDPLKVQQVHDSYFCVRWDTGSTQPLPVPPNVRILQTSPAADTVATPKFVPPGTQSPYLVSSLCSDQVIRFYTYNKDEKIWSTWPKKPLHNTDFKLPKDVSNTYICNSMPGRLAASQPGEKCLVVSMFESESSGGACWTLEDELTLECANNKGPVLMDWMSAANGTHILALVLEDNLWILSPCSCLSLHTAVVGGILQHQRSKKIESWVALLKVTLSTNGPANPRSLSWNSTGSLLLGVNTELQLFSPWYTTEEVTILDSHSHLERGVGNVYNDALSLQPRLPQYHPYVLRQLIDLRKVSEIKLILHHLLRYLYSYHRSTKYRLVEVSNIVDIIPPLPLHDMYNIVPTDFSSPEMSVIEGAQQGDYSALFSTTSYLDDSDDDQGLFSDEEEHTFIRRRSIAHSESEYDSKLCFGSKQAGDLDGYLSHFQLPGLTRAEQLSLSCLAITVGETNQTFSSNMHSQPIGQDLDDCGLRFTLELRYQNSISQRSEKLPLKPNDYIWAFHSSCQTQLIELVPGFKEKLLTWGELRSVGVGWWVKSDIALKNLIEIVCKTTFQRTKNPIDCALFYLAMKKKTLLQSLYRTVRDNKMAAFLKHDFTETRWKTAAKKNAFVLLSQQRYEHAAAFFLLADSLVDALELLLKYSQDFQLALVVARLYEKPQNSTSVGPPGSYNICYKRMLSTYILGKSLFPGDPTAGALMALRYDDDPFLCSMAHWLLGDYQSSLYCLLQPTTTHNDSHSKYILPNVFSFYCYLYHHPLLRRCKDPIRLPFTVPENITNDVHGVISLERRMIFVAAHTQFNMGAPTLSLEVLKYIDSGFTKLSDHVSSSGTDSTSTENHSTDDNQISTGMLAAEVTSSSTIETSAFSTPGLAVETKTKNLNDTSWMRFDAPVKISSRFGLDDEYEIDLSSSDSESSDLDGETPTASGELASETSETTELEVEESKPEKTADKKSDPFIVQLQLKCCIKILADELRFLPHALLEQFDPELGPFGGRAKLRAKRDSGQTNAALTSSPVLPIPPGANKLGMKVCQWLKNEIDTVCKLCSLKYSDLFLTDLEETTDDAERTILAEALHFTFKLEESVLTVLLLFCILHGDLDYNLAALRLELLFLLQEFHTSGDLSALIRNMEQETASVDLPPLLTTTAPPPLLLTPLNMLWQLTGHTLKLINRCHIQHTVTQSEMSILNSLSLSASACMWQCLALRHGGARIPDSYAIVKHRPLSWPGLSGHAVFFLVSAGKAFLVNNGREGALPIGIVLVEAIISVYLGLYLHAVSRSDAGTMTLLMYNTPSIDMWTKVTGTTVQSVDTSSPRAQKRVSIMGERQRIRVKGPRLPDKGVVTVRETFLPPCMSLVEYFKREHAIDTSNMFEVDSDCEETLDDDGDDPENYNSYSWHLMRLLSVVYVQERINLFLEDIGLTSAEMAGMSPLLASTMKTLDNWVEDLEQKLECSYPEGPPDNLLPARIPGYSLQQCVADPSFSPFRQNTRSSLPIRILWHKLATDTDMSHYLEHRDVEDSGADQEMSSIRTVFRSQEGVSSFALYQNSLSLMVVTTPHEILEIDVKTWLDRDAGLKVDEANEADVGESHSPFQIITTDENKPRNSHTTGSIISDTHSSENMEFFHQVLKRTEQGVRCAQAHNDLPLYITGHSDGYVKLWEFGYPHHLAKYGLTGTRGRVTNVHFGPLGAKFGLSDTNGVIGLWHTTVNSTSPYCVLNCHDRTARDFAFLGSASVIASVGHSSNNRNVIIWDTLMPASECAVKKFQAHDMGAMVCCYSPKRQVLVSGGNKGDICVFDIRQRKLQHMFTAHDSALRSICLSPDEETYYTGSAEGDIKSWSFGNQIDQHIFTGGHKSNKFFSNLPGGSLKGVMKLQIDSTNHLISCGADGEVKLRRLVL